MGERDRSHRPIDERRGFVRRLGVHEDVRRVDFTRDGFRTVFVELEPDADFRYRWYWTANRLGYAVERPGVDTSWPDWLAEAWVLRLSGSGTGEPTDRSTYATTIRGAAYRLMRRLSTRLPGYSGQ